MQTQLGPKRNRNEPAAVRASVISDNYKNRGACEQDGADGQPRNRTTGKKSTEQFAGASADDGKDCKACTESPTVFH